MGIPRAIFFGSPEFAVPSLSALCDVADVVTVVTQPDRPAGRGLELRPPAVKTFALERGLPVVQPTKVKTPDFAASLRALSADIGVVTAYGRILPRAVLDAPRLGCVNVHGSLLPRWRGAAPVHWAIVHGDRRTGVTLMQMDEGMDTGPMLSTAQIVIGDDDTAGEVMERLARLGGDLLRRDLPRYVAGELLPTPQPAEGATMAPLLKKEDGEIDWTASARGVHDRVRGMTPWPGATTTIGGRRVKVHRTEVVTAEGNAGEPGTVVRADKGGLHFACGSGVLAIEELQLEGKRRMAAKAMLGGVDWEVGTRAGTGTGTGTGGGR